MFTAYIKQFPFAFVFIHWGKHQSVTDVDADRGMVGI
ncbi:MAG: hypothetical protein AVDCRST_MAG86-4094 [uncultured Truepera sp.]|uniref:Uncharacterized protein n=1 Tax=uncultured Truepera sp. TaxID=543023 RepID=A0A6J4VT68_9DEIN|nr:MAG: hypothetical protein AVDCRST_MAG86-4094 [uncultured Truepera sp.]